MLIYRYDCDLQYLEKSHFAKWGPSVHPCESAPCLLVDISA